jgi:hypothetical protein
LINELTDKGPYDPDNKAYMLLLDRYMSKTNPEGTYYLDSNGETKFGKWLDIPYEFRYLSSYQSQKFMKTLKNIANT